MVDRLKALLLAERVTEPAGFSNTYHTWTGKGKGSASDASNWSDYTYSNAGIKYMEDAGAPSGAWIAKASANAQILVDKDVQVLGFEASDDAAISVAAFTTSCAFIVNF